MRHVSDGLARSCSAQPQLGGDSAGARCRVTVDRLDRVVRNPL